MKSLCPLYTHAADKRTYAARLSTLGPDDAAIVTSSESGPHPDSHDLRQRLVDIIDRGVTPLGYVPLGYGKRTLDDVLGDIIAWHRLYNVTRIFLDEWPSKWTAHHLGSLWGAVRAYQASTKKDRMIMCVNPGVGIQLEYDPPVGCFVVEHEGSTYPEMKPNPWSVAIVHSVGLGAAGAAGTRARLAADGWAYGYVTTDVLPNPFDEPSAA